MCVCTCLFMNVCPSIPMIQNILSKHLFYEARFSNSPRKALAIGVQEWAELLFRTLL